MSRHISTLNYLRSAATCLTRTVICWLSSPGITDSANKCRVFGGRFNQKSLARAQIATDSSPKLLCCRLVTDEQYVTSSRVINHVIAVNQLLHWLHLFYDTTSEKSRILFFQLAMSKKRTILSLDQGIEVLFRLGEAHHVERLLPSQCGKTQMARMISKQTGTAIVTYVEYKYSRTVCLQEHLSCYVALF